MKKVLSLVLVLCAMLSCLSLGAWAADGELGTKAVYPTYIPAEDFVVAIPRVDFEDVEDDYQQNQVDPIGDHVDGGSIELEAGQTRQMSVNISDLFATIRKTFDYAGTLQCEATVKSYNKAVASVEKHSDSNGYIVWTVTGEGNGSTDMSLDLVVTGNGQLLARQSYSYIVYVSGEEAELPDIPEIVPDVRIVDDAGNDLTDKTINLSAGGKITLHAELARPDKLWDDEWSYTNSNLFIKNVKWGFSDYQCAKFTPEGSAVTITGTSSGQVKVSALVTCGYAAYYNGELVQADQTYTETAKTTVKVGGKLKNPFAGIDPAKVKNPFSDLTKDHWAYDYIMLMYAAGMYEYTDFMEGVAPAKLSAPTAAAEPTYGLVQLANLSTGPVLQRLSNGANIYADIAEIRGNTVGELFVYAKQNNLAGSYTNSPFQDVLPAMKYYTPILWASSCGVVNGYGNGKFGPSDNITREQMCAILVRLADDVLGVTLPPVKTAVAFKDAGQVSSYAKQAVQICQQAGIVEGKGNNMFKPLDRITRGEMGAMIIRFANLIS